ncbi:MAG TPA: hypothetical protein VHT53_06480, partial [Candidatus Elarobacter sp.]|nr:hypothetical protein [Candidatus Elarobacter sp.]
MSSEPIGTLWLVDPSVEAALFEVAGVVEPPPQPESANAAATANAPSDEKDVFTDIPPINEEKAAA